ncbi:MAG: EAL domain-containing protein [Oxalobacter sp.]|nr:MAG: EAL domain-containing protein [Oxalobacter sp.]
MSLAKRNFTDQDIPSYDSFNTIRQVLREFVASIQDAMLVLDKNAKILSYNQPFTTFWNIPEDVKNSAGDVAMLNFVVGRMLDPLEFLHKVQAFAGSGKMQTQERIRLKDGRSILFNAAPILDADGKCYGQTWHFIDITKSKQAERDLLALTVALNRLSDAVYLRNKDYHFVYVNDAACQTMGYSREEFSKMTPIDIDPDLDMNTLKMIGEKHSSTGEHPTFQRRHRTRDGRIFPVEILISIIELDGEKYSLTVCRDISKRQAYEQELQRAANYDLITGLPNRRLLTDRLEQAIVRSKRNGKMLAVCYMDLDNFKPINDKYGHHIGDQLLSSLTHQLKTILREDDTLARPGGDEFVFLFNELGNAEKISTILDRLLAVVGSQRQLQNHMVNLSASIGVTLYPNDNVNADTLLRHADQAMYLAKEAGKNCYHFFDPDNDRHAQLHRLNFLLLQKAFENNEFILHYQPKVNLLNGTVVGAEALIRWQHPERGILPPSEFLPYLDNTDLEIQVGEWVIDSVLKQAEIWKAAGLTLTVSANISPTHLLTNDFAKRLQETLERYPCLTPDTLELEILESVALSDMSQAVNTLKSCRNLGVRISLDDFGTGYSSLTYLRNLPVDILKIDKSFVANMLTDQSDLDIIVSVVHLAKTFKREVIAEGVETLAQGVELVGLGCNVVQGYGISHPIPANQIHNWVSEWESRDVLKHPDMAKNAYLVQSNLNLV